MNTLIEYFSISSNNWHLYLIIGILTYLLIKWFIGKFIKVKSFKTIVTLIFTIIITPFLYNTIIVLFFSFLFYEYHPNIKFNKAKWNSNFNERFEMRKDIIDRKLLLGKTQEDVIEVLGLYNKKDSLSRLTYYMGTEGDGLMGIKIHHLVISFKENKVENVKYYELID